MYENTSRYTKNDQARQLNLTGGAAPPPDLPCISWGGGLRPPPQTTPPEVHEGLRPSNSPKYTENAY